MPTPPPAPRARPDGDRGVSRAERSARTAELLARASATADPTERGRLLDAVILVNRGVAEAVAGRYRGRGVAEEDLVQVAYEGLTKAVHRFDATVRPDLLTYAVPTIRGELQRHFRDHGWAVRPPRRIQELQARINRRGADLAQQWGREPTDAELADDLDVTSEEYDAALAAFGSFSPASLDRPAGPDDAPPLGELLGPDPDAGAEHARVEARIVLRPLISALSERDRRILYLRYFEDRSQDEIGRRLGVTQMQVSRLLARILDRLRREAAPAA